MYVFSPDFKLLNTFYLFTLSKCAFTRNSGYFTFTNAQFTFSTPKIEQLKTFIVNEVSTLQSDSELQQTSKELFMATYSKPTLQSLINRMRCKAEILNIDNIDDVIEIMERVILFRESKVTFSEFKNLKNACSIVFDILPLCTFINSIVVSSYDKFDPFDALTDFAAKNRTVEYIRIEGKITPKFENFLRAIQMNENNIRIMGLTFDGSHMNPTILRSLASCISNKGIPSVGFRNALKPDTVSTFYNFFLPGPVGKQLKFICIDSTPSVKVTTLMAKLSVLSVLSVTNCGLNIAKIFPVLSKSRVRTVDFSGNTCATSLADCDTPPPQSLVHIILNSITWGPSTLTGFFKYLENNLQRPLKLGLAQGEAANTEWTNFFKALKAIKITNLRELIWDNNPIHAHLFAFLMRNPKLHSLSISGCIHETDPDPIIPLSTYLVSSTSLTKLVISSNDNAYLGTFTAPVVASVMAGNTIEYLDINNSKSDNIGITQLKYLIKQSNVLRTLHCDGLVPQNVSAYKDLISTVVDTKKKRYFDFYYPQNDLNYLLETKQFDKQNVEDIKNSLMEDGALYHGQCTVEFTELVKNLSTFRSMTLSSFNSVSSSPLVSPILPSHRDNTEEKEATQEESPLVGSPRGKRKESRSRKDREKEKKSDLDNFTLKGLGPQLSMPALINDSENLVSMEVPEEKHVVNLIIDNEEVDKSLKTEDEPKHTKKTRKRKHSKNNKKSRKSSHKTHNNDQVDTNVTTEDNQTEETQNVTNDTLETRETTRTHSGKTSSDSDFIFGTDVLDGKDFKSIDSLSSSSQKANQKSSASEAEPLTVEKPSLTPNWTFPFEGQFFVDTEYRWKKNEYKYEISKVANELKHSNPQKN